MSAVGQYLMAQEEKKESNISSSFESIESKSADRGGFLENVKAQMAKEGAEEAKGGGGGDGGGGGGAREQERREEIKGRIRKMEKMIEGTVWYLIVLIINYYRGSTSQPFLSPT